MKLTTKIKLLTTQEQHEALMALMLRTNEASNTVSKIAFEKNIFGHRALREEVRRDLRTEGFVTALTDLIPRAVAASYKTDKKTLHTFGKKKGIPLNHHVLSYKKGSIASIWTFSGRIKVPFQVRPGTPEFSVKEAAARLIYQKGVFYICQPLPVEVTLLVPPQDFLGVDLGKKHIAVDSDDEVFTSPHLNGLRRRHLRERKRVSSKKTKSGKRHLKKCGKKEANFGRNTNHIISKRIVQKAKDTGRGIALEDLTGILKKHRRRPRITVADKARKWALPWSFYQLRTFIEYKAKRAGVQVVLVNPAYTSRTCPLCEHESKENRKTRDHFKCIRCGFSNHADYVAAVNIADKARKQTGLQRLSTIRGAVPTVAATHSGKVTCAI